VKLAAVAALATASVTIAGCGIGLASTPLAAEATDAATLNVDAGASTDARVAARPPAMDAAVGGDSLEMAAMSPLCGPAGNAGAAQTCSPDMGTCTPPTDDAGVGASYDGGPLPAYGCHVVATQADATAAVTMPACTPAAPRAKADAGGGAESACRSSAECEPGFECVIDDTRAQVDGAATQGVCRHYCCSNTCKSGLFCAPETAVGGAVTVPVCVPAAPAGIAGDAGAACPLLSSTACGGPNGGLSCQVVYTNVGPVAACVMPGTATAGQSCETTNCAAGFSCILGYFPNRECAQLCNPQDGDCPAGKTCTANAALSDISSQIGICM